MAWGLVIAVVFAACGTSDPPDLGGGLSGVGGADGGSLGRDCSSPGIAGCPCSQTGETAACGEVVHQSGNYITCSMGTSTCNEQGWGPCLSGVLVTRDLRLPQLRGNLHVLALGSQGPVPVGGMPCNPYCPNCFQTVDDPTSGFVAPAGFATGPGGLTLSGTGSVGCTSVAITPAPCTGAGLYCNPASPVSAVTVTSLTAPGTIGLTATVLPMGCVASPFTTVWTIDQPGQAVISGNTSANGLLTIGAPLSGTINVTAYAAGVSATAAITIKIDIVDKTGTTGDTSATAVQCGRFYTGASCPGATPLVPLAGSGSTTTWLYPYAKTYFPLGLPAPVAMYMYSATPSAGGAIKLSLRYPAGCTEGPAGTCTFNYSTIVNEPTPDPAVYTLQAAWQRFEQTAAGNDATLVLQRFNGTTLDTENPENIHFVNGQLKGTVYYGSYYSPQGGGQGAVLSIAPGATTPTLAVQPGAYCTVCHSLGLDGSKMITNDGVASNYPADENSSKRWNIAGGGAPSPPVLNTYANGGSGTDNDATGDKFTFGAPWMNGTLYMTHGGTANGDNAFRAPAAVSMLYDPNVPGTPKVLTNWPGTMYAVSPRFSPDGTKLAFGFWGTAASSTLPESPSGTLAADSTGHTLAVVDFTTADNTCAGGCSVSNARAVTTAASPGSRVAWPSFLPDGSSVVYQRQIVNSNAYTGWDPSMIGTVQGALAEIWISNVPNDHTTPSTPQRLNALNGLTSGGANYLPTASRLVSPPTTCCNTNVSSTVAANCLSANRIACHGGTLASPTASMEYMRADSCSNHTMAANVNEDQLDYLPAVNPTQAGNANWVEFTSRRMYGNIAYANPWDADPDQACVTMSGGNPIPPTKKLWVAALDSTYTPGTDPSHPAFYLPGQELGAGNSNGYWVNSACGAIGASCASNADCCGGTGGSPTNLCKITTAPSTKTCQAIGGACVASGIVCNTAGTPGDCCAGLSCAAAGALCLNPSTIAFTQKTYTREFVATCPMGTNAAWRFFSWTATVPANTSIAFAVQTKQLTTDTYAPAAPLALLPSATPASPSGISMNTVDHVLVAATLTSKAYLLVSMTFTPNAGGTVAPSLLNWQENYDCVSSE